MSDVERLREWVNHPSVTLDAINLPPLSTPTLNSPLYDLLHMDVSRDYSSYKWIIASRVIARLLRAKFKIDDRTGLRAILLRRYPQLYNSWFFEEYIHDTLCQSQDVRDMFSRASTYQVAHDYLTGPVARAPQRHEIGEPIEMDASKDEDEKVDGLSIVDTFVATPLPSSVPSVLTLCSDAMPRMFDHMRRTLTSWSELRLLTRELQNRLCEVPSLAVFPPGIVPLVCDYYPMPYCVLGTARACSVDAVIPPNHAIHICIDAPHAPEEQAKDVLKVDSMLEVVRALRPQLEGRSSTSHNDTIDVAPIYLLVVVMRAHEYLHTPPFEFPRRRDREVTEQEAEILSHLVPTLVHWQWYEPNISTTTSNIKTTKRKTR
jgi:hypothetical protein